MSNEKPKTESGFHSKLGPIPAEHFDNDFPSMQTPPKGTDPVYDKIDQLVTDIKKPKS